MIELLAPAYVLALVLGFTHAFEADHVAAVTTIATRTNGVGRSSILGVMWGVGHTATHLVIGGILLGFRLQVPPSFSTFLEAIVAGLLVWLGVVTIRNAVRNKIHVETHSHGGSEHTHVHTHDMQKTHTHEHTSFIVGVFHGLAGSGALALVAIASSNTFTQGALFIAIFGFGSIVGMFLLSGFVGIIMQQAKRFTYLHTTLSVSSGILSIVVAYTLLPIHEIFLLLV